MDEEREDEICGFSVGGGGGGTEFRSLVDYDDHGEDYHDDDDHGAKSMVEEEGEEGNRHICCECGKGFKSGKALGGHKRIHGYEIRKSKEKQRMINIPHNSNDLIKLDDGFIEVSCCVCGKKFTSMKALYGHMRFHPDRGWRGIQPPQAQPRPGSSSSSSSTLSIDHDDDDDDDDDDWESESIVPDQVFDLKESLKSWSITGKRGKRSSLKIETKLEDEMQEAVNDLLMLANAETKIQNPKRLAFFESDPKKIRRKKKKRLSEMEAGTGEKHVCVTCNKVFSSYQALGGHRASHNKVKNDNNGVGIEPLLASEVIGLSSNRWVTSSSSSSSNGDHQCNICYKRFATGQALGGHKRCHWVGPVEVTAASSSSQVTELTQEIKGQRTTTVLNFDLNQPPPKELW